MGEVIRNNDPNQSGLTVQQEPSTGESGCHAIAVTQGARSGRGRGLVVVSENPSAPAVTVRAPGTLMELRDAANATVLSVAQSGTLSNAAGSSYVSDDVLSRNYPSDQGLLAWTYDPDMAGHVTAQSSGGVAGRITLVKLIIRKTITWSNIWFGLSGIDAGASLTNNFLGVYNSAGTRMGTTADISASLMTGATGKSVALTAPFTATPGSYFIAMLLNGTWTTNALHFKASGAGISVNANLTAPNLRYSNMLTGQTSLPASLDLSQQATSIINTGWASQWYGVS